MTIFLNIALTFGIIFILMLIVFLVFKKNYDNYTDDRLLTYESVCEEISQVINDYISVDVHQIALTPKEAAKQEEHRREVSKSVRSCCSGDLGAREVVKEIISNYLSRDRGLTEDDLNNIIPFDNEFQLTARQLMEIMIYKLDQGRGRGFKKMCDETDILEPRRLENGDLIFEITATNIRDAYDYFKIKLDYSDKLAILTQLSFSDTYGLGVIDSINYEKGIIEEIMLGLTGLNHKVFDYREAIVDDEANYNEIQFARDSIHILIGGTTYRLNFLSFGSDEELQRVLRNLIKDSSAGELTVKNPEVVVETIDDRRVSIARPPISDSWLGLIRKFDTISVIRLEALYAKKLDAELLVGTIKNITKCGVSIAITGEMAAGKTTTTRAILCETRSDANIRVIESGSFELNTRKFLFGRNTMALRVNDDISEERVLAFVRKTTGQIFVIGEINSLKMANLAMNLDKFSEQMLFSAHYTTTEDMIADFTNAKLCIGGYTDETLAEMDAVRSLNFDIHLKKINGVREVQYINEIVPDFDFIKDYSNDKVTDKQSGVQTVEALRDVSNQLGKTRTYKIRKIIELDENSGKYIIHNAPSPECMAKAAWYMPREQYIEFVNFFNKFYNTGIDLSKISGSEESSIW